MSRVREYRTVGGFSLVELLTVVAIIGLLASVSVGLIRGAKQRTAIARAKGELALLAQALEQFRRHYGDYPQTGPSAANSQRVTGSAGPGTAAAQAILFNALTGAYGPFGPGGGRVNGPMIADVSKFTLEVPFTSAALQSFGTASGSPPAKQAISNAFLDPWGNRYLYFYKRPRATNGWNAPAYVLYSAGPDGAATALPNAAGIFSGTTRTAGDNADNIYSDL
jgi:prepilin-type N-terminal cleavage/methylation domain-containing protein